MWILCCTYVVCMWMGIKIQGNKISLNVFCCLILPTVNMLRTSK